MLLPYLEAWQCCPPCPPQREVFQHSWHISTHELLFAASALPHALHCCSGRLEEALQQLRLLPIV